MKKIAVALALVSAASFSLAAEVVGELRDVQGSVTVTSPTGVVKGAVGTPLSPVSRIMVGSGSKATLVLNEGCVIALKANQYVALDPKLACSQQVAAVTQLAAPYRVAQAPVGGGFMGLTSTGGNLLIAGGVIATLVVINEVASNDLSGQ